MQDKQYSEFSILREKSGLSLQDIAERSGRSLRTVYRWENGETAPEKRVTGMLSRIAEMSNVSLTDIQEMSADNFEIS